MTQLPGIMPDSAGNPLPAAVEAWRSLNLQALAQNLVIFLIIAVLLYLLTRLARRLIAENIEEVNRRHVLRKYIGYVYAGLLLAFAVSLFADSLTGFGTVLAVLLAGIAIALQDILKSFVGWLYINSRSGVEIGSRVEVGRVSGDVIDIGVLKTTVLEVGNEDIGQQSTGRLVTIPNFRFLAESVHLSAAQNPFVWKEIRVATPFESDWKRVESILLEVGDELFAEISLDVESGFRHLERRYAFKYGTVTPIVYVNVVESGVELTLRFLSPVRRGRGLVDLVSRRLLEAIAGEPGLRLAHPAIRIYQGESGTAFAPAEPKS